MAALEHTPEGPAPWERQVGETPVAWMAFQRYRDMPLPRSMRRLEAQGFKDKKRLGTWSTQWGWVARVDAYDAMLERERIAARVQGVRTMEERHAQIAEVGLAALAMPLIALGQRRQVGEAQVDRLEELRALPTGDLLRIASHASRSMARLTQVERNARGDGVDDGPPPAAASSPVEPLPEEERLRSMFLALFESGMVRGTLEVGVQEPDVGPDGLPILEALEPPDS